jgi:hypothetical protein
MSAFTVDNATILFNGVPLTTTTLSRSIAAYNDIGSHIVSGGVLTVPKNAYTRPYLQFTRNCIRRELVGICAFFNRSDVLAIIAALFATPVAVCTFRTDNMDTCSVILGGANTPYISRELGHFDVSVAIIGNTAVVSADISDIY